jgi:hypothetical protein
MLPLFRLLDQSSRIKLVSPPAVSMAGLLDIPAPAGTGTVNIAGVTPIPPAISIAIPEPVGIREFHLPSFAARIILRK